MLVTVVISELAPVIAPPPLPLAVLGPPAPLGPRLLGLGVIVPVPIAMPKAVAILWQEMATVPPFVAAELNELTVSRGLLRVIGILPAPLISRQMVAIPRLVALSPLLTVHLAPAGLTIPSEVKAKVPKAIAQAPALDLLVEAIATVVPLLSPLPLIVLLAIPMVVVPLAVKVRSIGPVLVLIGRLIAQLAPDGLKFLMALLLRCRLFSAVLDVGRGASIASLRVNIRTLVMPTHIPALRNAPARWTVPVPIGALSMKLMAGALVVATLLELELVLLVRTP